MNFTVSFVFLILSYLISNVFNINIKGKHLHNTLLMSDKKNIIFSSTNCPYMYTFSPLKNDWSGFTCSPRDQTEAMLRMFVFQTMVCSTATVGPSTRSVVTGGPAVSWATPAVPTPQPTPGPAAVTSTMY